MGTYCLRYRPTKKISRRVCRPKLCACVVTKILNYRIDKQTKSNASIDLRKKNSEISYFNHVHQKSKQIIMSSVIA